MPIYEYVCDQCNATTEALRAMRDADAPIHCEHCGSSKTRRAHSVVSVATSDSAGSTPLPMGGCGRCGDPNGSCGLN